MGQKIKEFENTPEGYAYSLRLDLTEIVLRRLGNNMTQARLADKAGIKPQMVTRIVHAASNCTFETAAKVLFALGVKARLEDVRSEVIIAEKVDLRYMKPKNTRAQTKKPVRGGETHEEKAYQTQTT